MKLFLSQPINRTIQQIPLKALLEATKVLANNPELTVNYTVDPSGISVDSIRLPQISRRMSREEVLIARGTERVNTLSSLP